MRRFVILFLCVISMYHSFATNVTELSEDSIRVCRLLSEASMLSADANKMLFFSKSFIGSPYVARTLEINDEEKLVVNTRQFDCTTFVETVMALILCLEGGQNTFSGYKKALTNIRYRKGLIDGYTSRLHYFSDWIDDNVKMGIVSELQSPIPLFASVQKLQLNYMSTHPEKYKALNIRPQLIEGIRKAEQALSGKLCRYIPKSLIGNQDVLRKVVADGDIIAIVCDKRGLDVAHLGIAVWHADGLHLLHASSSLGKIIEDTQLLMEYMSQNNNFLGVRVLRVH